MYNPVDNFVVKKRQNVQDRRTDHGRYPGDPSRVETLPGAFKAFLAACTFVQWQGLTL